MRPIIREREEDGWRYWDTLDRVIRAPVAKKYLNPEQYQTSMKGDVLWREATPFERKEILLYRIRQTTHRDIEDEVAGTMGFNMTSEAFKCGSPACIAGHCAELMGKTPARANAKSIALWLDVDKELSDKMYTWNFSQDGLERVTVEEVIEYLRETVNTENLDTLINHLRSIPVWDMKNHSMAAYCAELMGDPYYLDGGVTGWKIIRDYLGLNDFGGTRLAHKLYQLSPYERLPYLESVRTVTSNGWKPIVEEVDDWQSRFGTTKHRYMIVDGEIT